MNKPKSKKLKRKLVSKPVERKLVSKPNREIQQESYDYKWRQTSESYRVSHPFCVFCMEDGKYVSEGVQVDHIIPLVVRPDLKFTESNLRTLCRKHHGAVTRNFMNTGINELPKKETDEDN